jgi:hypothetical protein
VIRPRLGDSAADPLLVTGVLGAAALLRRLRALLTELAADGDRGAAAAQAREGAEACEVAEAREVSEARELTDVVNVVLGLAALAAAIEHRLPDCPAPATAAPATEREPINLLVKELLR